MVHRVSFHSILADRDSPLVISAVAWVLLGGKATMEPDRRALGRRGPDPLTPALWEKDTPNYHLATLLLWLLFFPVLIPARIRRPKSPGRSLSIRNLASSLLEPILSAHRATSSLLALAPPSGLLTHVSDQETTVLRLTGNTLVLRFLSPWQGQAPTAPRLPGSVLWSPNPNSLQQRLQ